MKPNPEIEKLSPEEQKEVFQELHYLNAITEIVWKANFEAWKLFQERKKSNYAFVKEKEMNVLRFLEEVQEGVEKTIMLLPAKDTNERNT